MCGQFYDFQLLNCVENVSLTIIYWKCHIVNHWLCETVQRQNERSDLFLWSGGVLWTNKNKKLMELTVSLYVYMPAF